MKEELERILKTIDALCNNPHWTTERRWRIADLATEGLRILERDDEASSRSSASDRPA